MFNYALINDGVCIGVSESPLEIENESMISITSYDEALIGKLYLNGVFTNAPTPPAPPPNRRITKSAWRSRFTVEEQIAVEMAALDDPTAPMQQRLMAAALRANLKTQEVATFIGLDDERVISGLAQLEAAGIIAAGRADQIRLPNPTPDEEFKLSDLI